MRAIRTTGLFLTVLACGVGLACRGNPVVPSLVPVDAATVLFVDDFESENNGAGVYNWTNFANWNVLDGCVDLHGNGFVDVQPGNGLYVDLDGSCDHGGTIETKSAFTMQPGAYILEFWMAGNHRITAADTVIITLGSAFEEQLVFQPNDRFRLFSRNISVQAETTARLRFQNLGGDQRGALLDLVRLRRAG